MKYILFDGFKVHKDGKILGKISPSVLACAKNCQLNTNFKTTKRKDGERRAICKRISANARPPSFGLCILDRLVCALGRLPSAKREGVVVPYPPTTIKAGRGL